MEIIKDYKELLELFNENKVEYLIVGAYALAFYGIPRYTGDLDIFVKPEKENAKRIYIALQKLGFSPSGLTVSDFIHPDRVIQLGVPPLRVDILTRLTGVSWEEAHSGRVKGKYSDIPIYYLGKEQFITNKNKLGRTKDLADIEALDKLG